VLKNYDEWPNPGSGSEGRNVEESIEKLRRKGRRTINRWHERVSQSGRGKKYVEERKLRNETDLQRDQKTRETGPKKKKGQN